MTEHRCTQDNATSDALNLVLEGLPEAFPLLFNQARHFFSRLAKLSDSY